MNIDVRTIGSNGFDKVVSYDNCEYDITDRWLEIYWREPKMGAYLGKVIRRIHIPVKTVLLIDVRATPENTN